MSRRLFSTWRLMLWALYATPSVHPGQALLNSLSGSSSFDFAACISRTELICVRLGLGITCSMMRRQQVPLSHNLLPGHESRLPTQDPV